MRGIRFAAGLLLLIVIGAPTYFLLAAARRSEERSATQALLVTLQSLVFAYSADYGDCPHPNAGGLTLEGITSCDNQGRILDAWDRPLVYRLEGGGPGRRVILYSLGPDGRDEDGLGDDVTSGNPQISVGLVLAPPRSLPLEIAIPPETGPMASPDADLEFDYRAWETAINDVNQLVPTELTADRYLGVLASPARTSDELLYKAAYVRFSIPRRSTDGGPAALLIAIYKSRQHISVRRAAFAAMVGGHLHVGKWRLDPAEHPRKGDSCPEPVLEEDAPQFAELAGHLLKQSNIDELESMIGFFVVNDGDLPSCFDAHASDFAQALAASQDTWSVRQIARYLTRNPSPHSGVLIAAMLDRYDDFPSTVLEALAPTYPFRLKEPLASAYMRFLDTVKNDSKYKHLRSQIEARLDR